jgi:hypothetical protein
VVTLAKPKTTKEDLKMSDTTYNGWCNFETWQAALWLDNNGTLEMLREYDNLTEEAITRELESLLDNIPASLLGDIVTSWLHCVRVSEILDYA